MRPLPSATLSDADRTSSQAIALPMRRPADSVAGRARIVLDHPHVVR